MGRVISILLSKAAVPPPVLMIYYFRNVFQEFFWAEMALGPIAVGARRHDVALHVPLARTQAIRLWRAVSDLTLDKLILTEAAAGNY